MTSPAYVLWARARGTRAYSSPLARPVAVSQPVRRPPPAPLPPKRALTARQHAVELRMHTRDRYPHPCWVDREHTCSCNGTLKHIGEAWADGIVLQLYQCSVCHEIWPAHKAGIPTEDS